VILNPQTIVVANRRIAAFTLLASAPAAPATAKIQFGEPTHIVGFIPSVCIDGAAAGGGLRIATLDDIVVTVDVDDQRLTARKAQDDRIPGAAAATIGSNMVPLSAIAANWGLFMWRPSSRSPVMTLQFDWQCGPNVCETSVVSVTVLAIQGKEVG